MSTSDTSQHMRDSKYSNINALLKKPFFRSQDAKNEGIPSRMLCYFCQKGILERLGRGLYRSSEFELDELAIVASTVPRGVVCLVTALCLHKLTDQMMYEYWIAVPNKDKSPKRKMTRIVRMRNMDLGLSSVNLGGFEIKIFDRERSVIDAFRHLSHEIAIKALQRYLKDSPDMAKLNSYAKVLKVDLQPYILALTT